MKTFKEENIFTTTDFPVDVFISSSANGPIQVDPHWHDYIEILYVIEGTVIQNVNDTRLTITKDDIVIIKSGDIHSITSINGDCKIVVLQFMPTLIAPTFINMLESKHILAFLNSQHKHVNFITNAKVQANDIYTTIKNIQNEYQHKDLAYELNIKGYIYHLIAMLIREKYIPIYDEVLNENDIARLTPLFKYIDEFYTKNICMEDIAKMINMNYHYFSRYFKQTTGANFKKFIDFVRIREAEKLLLTTEISICDIAYGVGFSNVSTFNRVFRKLRSCSPSSVRKSQ